MISNNYNRLVERFPLKPIKSEEDLDKAIILVNELTDINQLDEGQQDYLTTLSYLVEAYEEVHYPIPEPRLADFIQYLLEDCKGLDLADLDEDIKPIVLSIISGGINSITVGDLKKISSFFNVKPSAIVDLEYD